VAVVIDHNSRRVMGIAFFGNNPTAISVSDFLECAIHTASATPKYIICDKGAEVPCPLTCIHAVSDGPATILIRFRSTKLRLPDTRRE
jgi:hypothetical protein